MTSKEVSANQWQVTKEESGMRLLQFLRSKLDVKCSLRLLKQSLEKNLCRINGRVERFASTLVGRGDMVEFIVDQQPVHQNNKSSSGTQNKTVPPILFEDSDFLFIDKPIHVSSEDEGLLALLKVDRGLKFLALAHRLDKETSGVLIFAKSEQAREAIIRLFKERKVSKSYLAIVQGIPKESQGRIANFLGKISTYSGQSIWGEVPKEKGVLAITEWKFIKKGKGSALLACFPHTGRTHQIRVHMAGMGFPILGDSLYNKTKLFAYQPKRCLLHASKIEFIHPINGIRVSVESSLPTDFKEVLDSLKFSPTANQQSK
ncbi:MAG: RluA family pseudouridine synthase [Parachlamydiaceae bacterium]|nr:RluA family pseudouridine synthase [Parachlamydiaceae bacterium]